LPERHSGIARERCVREQRAGSSTTAPGSAWVTLDVSDVWEGSASTPTILQMLSVAEAAEKIGRNPETVRRWIRSGRLPARRVGRHHEIEAGDLRRIEDELFPMAELPEEWKLGDDGSPAPNWVAALHRSRSGH